MVKLFAGHGYWRAPGTTRLLVARARHIDDCLQACRSNGIDQLVILGAGLDSRAYHFERLREHVKVFEVEHPPTQQEKRRKLKEISSELPKHVALVPIDFNSSIYAIVHATVTSCDGNVT